jgi:hypothetical protein
MAYNDYGEYGGYPQAQAARLHHPPAAQRKGGPAYWDRNGYQSRQQDPVHRGLNDRYRNERYQDAPNGYSGQQARWQEDPYAQRSGRAMNGPPQPSHGAQDAGYGQQRVYQYDERYQRDGGHSSRPGRRQEDIAPRAGGRQMLAQNDLNTVPKRGLAS